MSRFTLSRYRDPSGYYTITHGDSAAGFVKWDGDDRLWRGFCRWARCNEVAQSGRKDRAFHLVVDHALIEHPA